ncbi:TonB-dependent receptor [Janthinobacterium agaricidamnosum]|uniref:TonB-dependent Receptor Plug domain protein n=1 Tax=Janthinobacterium agaricidamnosum NBRC 102515 = DSM 9628 TaxID=1349767 RepID=W0UZI2_9BURK|nr:TonB-dependent receptor [Janthinobacterium agaricidamnosum]CDG80790.1 tonB-dependent Receptor Plug domain protein [Janthinobacterium agaricidamnosum NBRC 102515 = DSM 9628]
MAFQEKIGVRSVRLALTVLAGTVFMAGHTMAADEQVQKVEITGSSIKRIAVEGALPVQRLSQEAIARTGATSVAELIQALPAMQGFTIGAVAAGSNSGGRTTASIHDIGEDYTLVLLNGRRIAPQGSGTTVNLNAIPMSAVERVEILTDGASALYGSDAIAGVINFILKKNLQGGTVDATYSAPQEGGGNAWNTSVTYGFGDLETDRFNIMASYRHDDQAKLRATDRSFSGSSYIPFSVRGTNYIYDRTSTSSSPAGATVAFKDAKADPSIAFTPYLAASGHCGPNAFVTLSNNKACGYDTGGTVEMLPESKRDSLFTRGTYKISDSLSAFAEVALSRYDLTARIAANPVAIPIAKGSALYNTYIKPYLTPEQEAKLKSVSANYRMTDWGLRASNSITDTKHLVLGVEGEIGEWNFESGLTWSQNAIDERYIGGYAKNDDFRAIINNPLFNPFTPTGSQSAEIQALIPGSQFNGSIRTASTTMRAIDSHGSREVFALPGGKASLGIGGDYREYKYEQSPDAAANSDTIYNFNTSPAYDLSRKTYGVFAELLAPLSKTVEVTLGGRYDSVSAIDNGITNTKMGKDQHASTYKVSARWQPVQTLLFRGSYGTGFKAPSMLDIGQPLVNNGFTAKPWNCPFPGDVKCRSSQTQYNQLAGGNENLRPEKSKQYTYGFRIEPSSAFSFGADLWDVKITDAVSAVSETQAFSNPALYSELFGTYVEPTTGLPYYAFKKLSLNIGQKHNRGIDWDMTVRQKTDFGNFTANVSGTHMLRADYTVPGTKDQWTNNMNFFGITDEVTFRDLFKINLSLESGKLTNSVIISYRNGYTDASATVLNLSTNKFEDIRLEVPSYTTVDWQGRYVINEKFSVRGGIKNLLNVEPPLSLRASSGHQVGFDPRYADPTMRSFYLTGSYKF